MLNKHNTCEVRLFWSAFGGYDGEEQMNEFLRKVSGIEYFKGTIRTFNRVIANYRKQLDYFKKSLSKYNLNPLYPLLEFSQIKYTQNEDIINDTQSILVKESRIFNKKKPKAIKKIIFDSFISEKSTVTLNAIKSGKPVNQNSIVEVGQANVKSEDMTKVNCCYTCHCIIKMWVENRNKVLTFQAPALMAKIFNLKKKCMTDWSIENFESIVNLYAQRLYELKSSSVNDILKKKKRN